MFANTILEMSELVCWIVSLPAHIRRRGRKLGTDIQIEVEHVEDPYFIELLPNMVCGIARLRLNAAHTVMRICSAAAFIHFFFFTGHHI